MKNVIHIITAENPMPAAPPAAPRMGGEKIQTMKTASASTDIITAIKKKHGALRGITSNGITATRWVCCHLVELLVRFGEHNFVRCNVA